MWLQLMETQVMQQVGRVLHTSCPPKSKHPSTVMWHQNSWYVASDDSSHWYQSRHGYKTANQEAEAKADALATLEAKAEATASQRLRSQSRGHSFS